jgi:antitoxin component YwqK of YwqJK toxin-antitoxin module
MMEGEYKLYYENGQLHIISNYINEKMEGEYKKYYVNGQLYIISNYVDGIENGEYNGFSIEYLITPVPALAVVEVDKIKFLESNPAKDHTHKLWVILDEKGNIVKGRTSEEGEGLEKHYHTITSNSVTNITYEHSHGIQL